MSVADVSVPDLGDLLAGWEQEHGDREARGDLISLIPCAFALHWIQRCTVQRGV